ncbi:GNAT family N-acetyltransferase [Kribbella turkmenica]|uniref:GNAT family N-acetyltransferase n=1 Tax=Kribbella turkmenica TaxID=2530375 RepID=A0A4R4XGH0_9ACTN|nr:GNAT family N-acetyltransferase [Kribbella turkmenica]TDD30038.1 GNAT family N-acetyltransferase [Kribbella turkmenica]
MDELLRRWVEGGRLCRGLAPAIEYGDALAVTLGLPGRERELFALTDESAVVDRLAAGTDQDVWLTVTTQDGDTMARRLTDAGLEPFAEHRQLMSIDLEIHPRPSPAYAVEVESRGPLEYVRILASDGEVAAHGMAAVVGGDAVMHDIQTDPAYRRRGLGSVVMGALSRRAVERGASAGLLMASAEGGYLYTKLGWLPEATMVTAKRSGAAGAVGSDLGAVLAGG